MESELGSKCYQHDCCRETTIKSFKPRRIRQYHLQNVENRSYVTFKHLGNSVLECTDHYRLSSLKLVELGAQELLPTLDRPGGGDELTMAGRAKDLSTLALQELLHHSSGGVGSGDGRDLLVGHVHSEVGRPWSGDILESSLEIVDA